MKRKVSNPIAGLLSAALGRALVGTAQAADSDQFTLTVTIGNQLSVLVRNGSDVERDDYNFETMVYGDVSVNRDDIRIDNDGGITTTYELSMFDAGGGLTLRTGAGALASDEYRVQALFQDVQPGHASFADEDIVTTTSQTAQVAGASAVFATATTPAVEDGVAVIADDRLAGSICEVRLWLRLELASSGAASGLQTGFATVVINAI